VSLQERGEEPFPFVWVVFSIASAIRIQGASRATIFIFSFKSIAFVM
jgi:hypothetical protein